MSLKIYFASDFHLGVDGKESSEEREQIVINWLDEVKIDATEIFLLGDVFDFWLEYAYTVPKGFVGLLAKLKEITSSGIPINFFTGNHDMWTFGYLAKECGLKVYRKPILKTWNGKTFLLGHGDGLGPGDYGHKALKFCFESKFWQFILKRFHPNLVFHIAHKWSGSSRRHNLEKDSDYKGKDKEWLYVYAQEFNKKSSVDYFIFGHRHLALCLDVSAHSKYINLGEWINNPKHYAVFDGEKLCLEAWKGTPNFITQ